ncbi:sugar phosphate nucleotidyltransferase [Streptomyces sp. NPDC088812]|uniref:sugar phosphate nucleotidyltransferase n=1 Tax=Streptomyces sp. NPDC088812 TaxID=3365905 RepID=UPI00381029D3
MRIAGMVLGAGAGSRLRPLTDTMAKPLVPVLDRPLVSYVLDHMAESGVRDVFVNLHHHAEEMDRALFARGGPLRIVTRVEPRLSGPAGALRMFADELAGYEAVLVSSGDVFTLDGFNGLLERHLRSGHDLTVAVTHRQRARHFGVLDIDDRGQITGAREKPAVPDDEWHWISAGVYCLSPALIKNLPANRVYDFAADLVPDLLTRGQPVGTFPLPGYWQDVGTAASLREANLAAVRSGVHIGAQAVLGPDVELRGSVVIGAGAKIGAHTWLEETVVLPGTVVAPHSVLVGALVGSTAVSGAPVHAPCEEKATVTK